MNYGKSMRSNGHSTAGSPSETHVFFTEKSLFQNVCAQLVIAGLSAYMPAQWFD